MGNNLEEVRLETGSNVESQGDQTGKRREWAGLFRSRTDGETVITEQTGSRGDWGGPGATCGIQIGDQSSITLLGEE